MVRLNVARFWVSHDVVRVLGEDLKAARVTRFVGRSSRLRA